MRRYRWRALAVLAAGLGLAVAALSGQEVTAAPARVTLLSTVTRVVNLPLLVGFKLLRQDGLAFEVRDLRTPEAVVLATAERQGQFGTGFAAFYPAVEKGAPVRALFELSKPEFVVVARREITAVAGLTGVRLASHSPGATVQALLEFFLLDHPGVTPTIVFMPEGSPARAEAILRGAVDAAAVDLTAAQVVLDRAPGRFHILIDLTRIPVSSSFLIARQDFIEGNQPLIRQVLRRLLESYRRGIASPAFWATEGAEFFPQVPREQLERQLAALVRVFDPNGGIDRMTGAGAISNIQFQVATKNLTGPALRWRRTQFFDTDSLERLLGELGKTR
ncbi:MAG: ABC transporter substrate-binding protein [Armatimonadota bacterium]|nr:ABC transporter substrate-binding protein [Armatimonadota bacterium]MDR7532047.1 ABC transporter substrate-binding protein [Armatimonadota bacterium]MDR7535978.1 ABC transporter substrate-binding protein [Armatimonadota bacterium]